MSLLSSYGLLRGISVIIPCQAKTEELQWFHSKDYLDFCDKASEVEDSESSEEEFGLSYDCPLIPDMSDLIKWIAGGSMSAAKSLATGSCKVAMNWGGGWHHSQRDQASGFCYVNDIVLAIHTLRKVYDKVLYIDLDIHHGKDYLNLRTVCLNQYF